jgi:hypothetical protein
LRDVELTILNQQPTSTAAAQVQPWFLGEVWTADTAGSAASGATFTYKATSEFAAVEIDGRYFFAAHNPSTGTPTVDAGHGGTMTSNGYVGGTAAIAGQTLEVGSSIPVTIDRRSFVFARLADTATHTVFSLTMQTA